MPVTPCPVHGVSVEFECVAISASLRPVPPLLAKLAFANPPASAVLIDLFACEGCEAHGASASHCTVSPIADRDCTADRRVEMNRLSAYHISKFVT